MLAERLAAVGRRMDWQVGLVPSTPAQDEPSAADPTLLVPVPGEGDWLLRVAPAAVRRPGSQPQAARVDPVVAHYLAGLVGADLARDARARDADREVGAELMAALVDGSLRLAGAAAVLRMRGLPDRMVCLALAGGEESRRALLHHHPVLAEGERPVAPPLLPDGPHLLVLLPDDERLASELLGWLGGDARAGRSRVLLGGLEVPDAIRQARLALAGSADAGRGLDADSPQVADYGGDGGLGLPPTTAEAQALVERWLGPLLRRDETTGSALVATLAAYLERDGAWTATAADLHIHRQTLVHRMRTIEALTGLRPASTVGTATLWRALESARALGLVPR